MNEYSTMAQLLADLQLVRVYHVKTPQEIIRTHMQHAMTVGILVSSAWLQTFLAAPTMRL